MEKSELWAQDCNITFVFGGCLQQLFGKLDELTNQLTSDEPKENVDASPALLARQEQLQDAILSASGQMQKESQALLEELRKVSK